MLMTRVLSDFPGRYAITREIEDIHAGQVLRFVGEAEISRFEDGAVYAETGKMTFPNGQSFQSERRYRWRNDGALVRVCFDDGRRFHDFDPAVGGAASEHRCGEDLYRGGYDFSDWPRWSLTWSVSGPRKAYRSQSIFIPVK